LLSRRHVLHQPEENYQVQDEKPVGDRNKSPPRHRRNDGGEERVREDHRDEDNGEHPPKIFELGRADVIANRPDHVIAGEQDKKENEAQPESADFLRFYVNDLGEELFQARLCQAASTSAPRSAVRPARSFDCRSLGSDLNQLSVSRAVSASGRNVKPFAKARLILVRARPLSFAVQTGLSDHGSTFCWVRNSSFTQVKVAFDFSESLIPSSFAPMSPGFAGPVAMASPCALFT